VVNQALGEGKLAPAGDMLPVLLEI